jgi:hypothetical protein
MMNNARIFVICGKVQHGKTTLANYLATAAGLPNARDCSSVIYRELSRRRGVSEEELRAMDKEGLREELADLGDELCGTGSDPGFLAKSLYYGESRRVVAGVRRVPEFDSLVEAVGRDNVIGVWIDRPGGPDIEDNTEMALEYKCNIRVLNYRTAPHLADVAQALASFQVRPNCAVTLHPLHSPLDPSPPTRTGGTSQLY